MMRFVNILFVFVALFMSSCTKHVKVYPAPEGIELSNDFQVEVEGMKVSVYKTKIPPAAPIPRLNHSRSEFGFASIASFDINEKVSVSVTYPEAVKSVKILPASFGIKPKFDGHTITFMLDNPGNLTIEVNGDWHQSLHIFANPFEENIPKADDPDIVYYNL